uniref:Multidrug and toxin extrusion protein n=1 Tax=Seriola dumerili TaxID=41447 RepID=A0A3B4TFK7_SERDU
MFLNPDRLTVVEVVSSKLFRCACVRRWLPLAYREELYHVLRLTGPLLLSRILNFLLPFVITIFCGHIGNAELAGYALASATINLTTTATGYGLAVACDTLISQTFGRKNMKRVGVILQRSSLILLLFCLPCWALLINAQNLLLILYQENEVVCQFYCVKYSLCLSLLQAMFLHQLQVAYLQNQGIILPQMYTAAAANIFNLGFNYVLIISFELGQKANVAYKQYCWSTDCLQEWGLFMKLAIPSAFMVYFEWWIWEIGGFLAGVLGEVDLGAQHVLVEVGAITYMFPLGVHAATCVRVGNALGAGDTARAIVTCKVALVLSGVLAVFQGIVIAGCKSVVGYIFTSDENIVEIVSENLTVYTFLQFFDALLCVCSGILVGSGMQKIAALSNLVCYYCIGLPVGIALMFAAQLRILGFWLGLLISVFLETGFFLLVIFKLNWKKVTHKAQMRAGKKVVVIPKRPASTMLNEAMVPDVSDCPNTVSAYGDYSHTDLQQHLCTLKAQLESEEVPKQSKNNASTKPQALLSVTQLILRRGLTFLVSVLILAVGVACHFAFPAPEPSAQSRANFTLNWANASTPTPPAPLDLTPNL